jgi:acetyltransferase-like isoleucine patch superfamily enzyme
MLKRKIDIKIGKHTNIGRECYFEGRNYLSNWVDIQNSSIGFASYLNEHNFIQNCIIGRYTCIGPRVKTVFGTHPTSQFVSIHPAFYSLRKQCGFTYVSSQKFEEFNAPRFGKYSIKIGNDVWIGADVNIIDGVEIGDGSIVMSGAVVTKDVPRYAIVGGVPAKVIKYRFSAEEISFLTKLNWWNKDISWIQQYADNFEDIKSLMEVCDPEGSHITRNGQYN